MDCSQCEGVMSHNGKTETITHKNVKQFQNNIKKKHANNIGKIRDKIG